MEFDPNRINFFETVLKMQAGPVLLTIKNPVPILYGKAGSLTDEQVAFLICSRSPFSSFHFLMYITTDDEKKGGLQPEKSRNKKWILYASGGEEEETTVPAA